MSVKLLTEHHLEFLSLKEAAQARLSLHMSKCHIVGNHMSGLIFRGSELNSPEHNMSLQTSNHSLDQPADTKCTCKKKWKHIGFWYFLYMLEMKAWIICVYLHPFKK